MTMLGLVLAVVASAFDIGTESDDFDVRVRQEQGSPFVCVDFAPKAGAADRVLSTASLPPIRVNCAFRAKPVMQGAWGLKPLAAGRPSATYLAVAEPYARHGVVCAYLTNLKACGAVDLGVEADGTVVFKPIVDYGRMLVRKGEPQAWETIVLGEFDDCRKGLERYADEVAKRFDIRLPPNRSGATTWCFDRFGYSDRSTFKGGCGCGTPESARRYADAAEKLRPFGFDFYQIDDQWQDGSEAINGPARIYDRCNPKGPFPDGFAATVRDLNDRGITAGLWFIPFGGQEREKDWAYGDIFVKSANDVPKLSHSAFKKPLPYPKRKGETCRSVWNGDPVDFSRPGGRAYLAGLVKKFTYGWGFRYLKCDGISGGFAADLYGGEEWMDQGFANAVFADPTTSNVENYRRGFETIRKAAAPGTFILACNLGSIRAMAPSFGLVDGMRIGNDNGPIDEFPERYLIGQVAGSSRYFFNGRVWWADPDSVYVRKTVPYTRAKSTASWVWLTDSLYECGDWLPDLPDDRVELLRRTLRHHGSTNVRPIDFFESEIPNAWLLETKDGVQTLGVFNWSTNKALAVDYPFDYAGLDPDAAYTGEEMWSGEKLPAFRHHFRVTVPPDDCRIYRLKKGPML